MEQLPLRAQKAFQAALRRARKWCRPPHWDHREWQEELSSLAQASAFEACSRFDERQCVPLEAFVFCRVLIALRDFHRNEWAYFVVHYGHFSRIGEGNEEGGENEWEGAVPWATEGDGWEWQRYWIHWALERLEERERQVIRGLYWGGKTETEIAREMKVSQQAVSKIKQKALQKLRDLLKGLP